MVVDVSKSPSSRAWHPCAVTDQSATWVSVPDAAEQWQTTPTKVRQFLEERVLLGTRRNGLLQIPQVLLTAGPVKDLPGTITVLLDGGFSDDDALDWLMEENPALGTTPLDALGHGRKKEVRRLAQSLAV